MIPGIEARLPEFLIRQRWYGEKASTIESIAIVDSGATGEILHFIVDVRSQYGAPAQYYVPLVASEHGEIADATHHPSYHHWIASNGRNPAVVQFENGRLIWEPARIEGREMAPQSGASRVLAVEQSNTSIRFGDVALVKILRRLQPGVNPEIELTRFLTERTDFKYSPALLGTLTYRPDHGAPVAIAVAQAFVPSISDGWTAVLASLAELGATREGDRPAVVAASHDLIRQLGRRTAELHLALSSDLQTPALAPEAIADADVRQWRAGFMTLLDRVTDSLERHPLPNGSTSDLKDAFITSKTRFVECVSGFDRLAGVAKIRVHGDYHLGQTLLTHDRDWCLLDFEGEPQRTLEERRAKTSPLKDVAGMLRSFSYARGTAEQTGGDLAQLVNWERGARTAFLDGYLTAARAGKAGFLPITNEDIRLALGAWELDKAIYEIDYELNNRPDWLWLPLSAALKFV